MRTRTTAAGLAAAAVLASAALAGGATARPHVAAQYRLPGGLPAGGAIVEGADGAMYAATGVKPTPHKASKVVRITGKGRITLTGRLTLPGGLSIDGIAGGPANTLWVQAYSRSPGGRVVKIKP